MPRLAAMHTSLLPRNPHTTTVHTNVLKLRLSTLSQRRPQYHTLVVNLSSVPEAETNGIPYLVQIHGVSGITKQTRVFHDTYGVFDPAVLRSEMREMANQFAFS
jgi:hypothetical protein